jgi:hypothetical protein
MSALPGSTVATLDLAMHNQSKHTLFPFVFVTPSSTMTASPTMFNAVGLALVGIQVVSENIYSRS